MATTAPMSGRKAQAARNDEAILQAARDVFIADAKAPIADVAKHAGVGISALYRRYPSKEDLLRKLCGDGLLTYIAVVEEALADDGDPWEAFCRFMHSAVDADTTSLTIPLAGTFMPTPEMFADAVRAEQLSVQLLERTRAGGVIRSDIENSDIGLMLEQLASVHLGDKQRSMRLRHRYLTVLLDGLRAAGSTELPGPAPTDEELSARWTPA